MNRKGPGGKITKTGNERNDMAMAGDVVQMVHGVPVSVKNKKHHDREAGGSSLINENARFDTNESGLQGNFQYG